MRARNTDADEVETVRKTCVVFLRDLEYKNLLLLLDAYKDILLVDGFSLLIRSLSVQCFIEMLSLINYFAVLYCCATVCEYFPAHFEVSAIVKLSYFLKPLLLLQ